MKKYSVKLLFQYRIDTKPSEKMRTCEEKILLFNLKENKNIITVSLEEAKKQEFDFVNDNQDKVYFEFIGIVDICHLGIEVEKNEVWYDVKTMLTPMERKDKLLPSLEQLQKRVYNELSN